MKKRLLFMAGVVAASLLSSCAVSKELPEWTVLNYLVASTHEESVGTYSSLFNKIGANVTPNKNVNWIVEVGGTTKWSGDCTVPGIKFDSSKSQRYIYKDANLFEKVFESDLRNMADPSTLSDFISWGVKNYPAKRYALVMHNHGGGAYYGFGLDTAFSNPGVADSRVVLTLDNLEYALKKANAKFEFIEFNACLMSSIETTQAVKDYASYMIANEESSASFANPMIKEMTYLYENYNKPSLEMAKSITKMIAELGQEKGLRQRNANSLIDLKKIDPVTTAFNNLWKAIRKDINNCELQKAVTDSLYQCDRMLEQQNRDIVSFVNKLSSYSSLTNETSALKKAIEEAVIQKEVGKAHANAGGLSFYFENNFTNYQYDHLYRGETHNLEYMAYIDAITPWWVANNALYDQVEKYENSQFSTNSVNFTEDFSEFDTTGKASFTVTSGINAVYRVEGLLYRKNSRGTWFYLGKDVNVDYDSATGKGSAKKPEYWTYFCKFNNEGLVEKHLATLDVTQTNVDSTLYSIPVVVPVRGVGASSRSNAEIIATFDNRSLEYDIHGICCFNSEYDKVPGAEYMEWPTPFGEETGFMTPLYYSLNSNNKKGSLMTASFGSMIMYDSESAIGLDEYQLEAGTYGYAIAITDIFGHEITHSQINEFVVA